jgi:hypothetical protein
LENAGESMIKWPELKIPAINLWNCPRQDELERINADKTELKRLENRIQNAVLNVDLDVIIHSAMSERIKEREFLYYLRSGRFPE